jgi:hypothetical protein
MADLDRAKVFRVPFAARAFSVDFEGLNAIDAGYVPHSLSLSHCTLCNGVCVACLSSLLLCV